MARVILIHLEPQAPAKPAPAAPCNGCGVCCAVAPCPLGMLVSRRRHGACTALRWVEAARQYRCGLIVDPAGCLPAPLRPLAPLLGRLAPRYVSAGSGCDCDLEAAEAPAGPTDQGTASDPER